MAKSLSQPRAAKKSVTLAQVAAHCEISLTAASLALRGDTSQVSQKTIDRVRIAATELGYDAARNHFARRLAMRRVGVESINQLVAMLVPEGFHETNYHMLMFRGVMDELTQARFGLLTTCSTGPELSGLPETFLRNELDGLLLLGAMEGSVEMIRALRAHPGFGSAPVLALSIRMDGCGAVLLDDYAGGLALGRHLLQMGHRFLLTHDGGDFRATSRRQGLHAALGEAGLDPVQHCLPYAWHSSSLGGPPSPSGPALLATLRANPRVTCVVGANDPDACEIAGHLQRAGYSIPGDISLTGYDDTDALLDTDGRNMLTTVRVDLREAGRLGARRLLEQIRLPMEEFAASEVTLPVSLQIRRSTGPPPLEPKKYSR